MALLLVSCGGAPCPQPVDGSAREVNRLVPVVSNPAAPPAQRAEAVHGLGCMVAALRIVLLQQREASGPPRAPHD